VQGEVIFILQIDPQLSSEAYDLNRKEFNYASVLANRVVKCSLCSQVDDVSGIWVIVMPIISLEMY